MKDFIIKTAREQGEMLLKYFNEAKSNDLSSIRSSVKAISTKYDKMIDLDVIAKIEKEFPAHSILTEESGLIDKKSEYIWIVDSLDGTANFACGNPLFAFCIALLKGKEVVAGAISCPAINEFYYAEKGKGAFLNDKRIHVSSVGDISKSYSYSCEGGEKDRKVILKLIDRIYANVLDFRKLGSAGIEAAWVALGRAEFYATISIEPWDIAPAVLLVQEAGGKVTDFEGKKWDAKKSNMIFSNGIIHDSVINLIK